MKENPYLDLPEAFQKPILATVKYAKQTDDDIAISPEDLIVGKEFKEYGKIIEIDDDTDSNTVLDVLTERGLFRVTIIKDIKNAAEKETPTIVDHTQGQERERVSNIVEPSPASGTENLPAVFQKPAYVEVICGDPPIMLLSKLDSKDIQPRFNINVKPSQLQKGKEFRSYGEIQRTEYLEEDGTKILMVHTKKGGYRMRIRLTYLGEAQKEVNQSEEKPEQYEPDQYDSMQQEKESPTPEKPPLFSWKRMRDAAKGLFSKESKQSPREVLEKMMPDNKAVLMYAEQGKGERTIRTCSYNAAAKGRVSVMIPTNFQPALSVYNIDRIRVDKKGKVYITGEDGNRLTLEAIQREEEIEQCGPIPDWLKGQCTYRRNDNEHLTRAEIIANNDGNVLVWGERMTIKVEGKEEGTTSQVIGWETAEDGSTFTVRTISDSTYVFMRPKS